MGRAPARLNRDVDRVPAPPGGAILGPVFAAERQRGGEKIVLRASLIWIPLAVGTMVAAASPLAAQQTTPSDQTAPQQLAPPVPQNSAELPPPFPHYPARAPREHDPNYRASAHRHSQPARARNAHHQAKPSHHSKATHHAKADHRGGKSHAQAKHQYFSKRTIRQCHGMTYKQIMAHQNCRTMMKQELAEQQSQKAKHRKSTRTTKTKTKARHHRR